MPAAGGMRLGLLRSFGFFIIGCCFFAAAAPLVVIFLLLWRPFSHVLLAARHSSSAPRPSHRPPRSVLLRIPRGRQLRGSSPSSLVLPLTSSCSPAVLPPSAGSPVEPPRQRPASSLRHYFFLPPPPTPLLFFAAGPAASFPLPFPLPLGSGSCGREGAERRRSAAVKEGGVRSGRVGTRLVRWRAVWSADPLWAPLARLSFSQSAPRSAQAEGVGRTHRRVGRSRPSHRALGAVVHRRRPKERLEAPLARLALGRLDLGNGLGRGGTGRGR